MSVYNCENTVKKSIDSIVEQTFTDWELIICDDGSKDNTYKLVQEIAKEEPRIVLIKNDRNRGLSYSLNHCLKVAKGSYCVEWMEMICAIHEDLKSKLSSWIITRNMPL